MDIDIFSSKYDIEELFLYPLGKENDEEYQIDLRGSCGDCELYENIFSPFLEFKIHVIDTLGILRNLPLRGGELLKVRFKIWSALTTYYRSYTFRLVTFKKLSLRDNVEVYSPMMFMSKQYFHNQSYRVNWAYPQSSKFKDIVNDLLKILRIDEEGKIYEAHETNGLGSGSANQITFTNITPLECIYRLMIFTHHSDNNKLADFLFFECLDEQDKKKFMFKSLNKMIEEARKEFKPETSWKFKFFPYQHSYSPDPIKMIGELREKKFIPVSKYDIKDNRENIKGIENSLAGGTLHHLNIVTKSLRKTEMDVDHLFKAAYRLNNQPWFIHTDNEQKHFFTKPSQDPRIQNSLQQYNMFKMFDYNVFNRDTRDYNTDLIRKFNFNTIDQLNIYLRTPGHSEIFIGKMTTFETYEMNIKGYSEIGTTYETDLKYMIIAIKHLFNSKDYHMIVNITADGEFNNDIYPRYDDDKKEWVKEVGLQFSGKSNKKIPGYGNNEESV